MIVHTGATTPQPSILRRFNAAKLFDFFFLKKI
jgi:hypothetical protein